MRGERVVFITDLSLWGRKLEKAFTPITDTLRFGTSILTTPIWTGAQVLDIATGERFQPIRQLAKSSWEYSLPKTIEDIRQHMNDPEVQALMSPEGWKAFTAHDWKEYKQAIQEASQAFKERAAKGEHWKNAFSGLFAPTHVVSQMVAIPTTFAAAGEPAVGAGIAADYLKGGLTFSGLSAGIRAAAYGVNKLFNPQAVEGKNFGEYVTHDIERDFMTGALLAPLAKGAEALVHAHFVAPSKGVTTLGRAIRGSVFFGGAESVRQLMEEGKVHDPLAVAGWAAGGAALDALIIPALGRAWQKRPHFGIYRSPEEKSRQVIATVWADGGKGGPRQLISLEVKPHDKLRVSLPRIRLGPTGFKYTGKPVNLRLEGLDPMATKLYSDFLRKLPDDAVIRTTAGKATTAREVKQLFKMLLDTVDDVYKLKSPTISQPKVDLGTLIEKHSKIYNALKEQYGDDVARAWKDVMLKHVDKGGLTRYWFGSSVQTQQMGDAASRPFGDFDAMLSAFTGPKQSKNLYRDLVKALGPDKVRLSGDLIELKLGNSWVHAWNPHYGAVSEYFRVGGSKYLAAGKEPLEAVKTDTGRYIMDIREQFLRKVSSLLKLQTDNTGKLVFGTEPHRIKDAQDVVAILKYLANEAAKTNPAKAAAFRTVAEKLERQLMRMGFITEPVKAAAQSAASTYYRPISQSVESGVAAVLQNLFKGISGSSSEGSGAKASPPPSPKIYLPTMPSIFSSGADGATKKDSGYGVNEQETSDYEPPSSDYDNKGSDYESEGESDYDSGGNSGSDYGSDYSSSVYMPKSYIEAPYMAPLALPHVTVPVLGVPIIRMGMPKGRKTTSTPIKTRWVSEVDML